MGIDIEITPITYIKAMSGKVMSAQFTALLIRSILDSAVGSRHYVGNSKVPG